MDKLTQEEALSFLKEQCLYSDARFVDGETWVAIVPLLYTHGIIKGTMETIAIMYEDRWCYHSYEEAKKALDEWNGIGEPKGWHRHPDTGRRRDKDGNEWIAP